MGNKTGFTVFFITIRDFLASVRLSIFLLLSLAVTSILGTVIPQNGSEEMYRHKYGDVVFAVIDKFAITDMYHSWWFRLLLIMLAVNLVVCSLNRLKATLKIVLPKKKIFHVERYRKMASKKEVDTDIPYLKMVEECKTIFSTHFGAFELLETDRGTCLHGEKGRWSRLGVYAVHFSILLLLAGGLVGSIAGFEGYVNIPEGESADEVILKNEDRKVKLDFSIRCEDFSVSFYESGAPREYKSDLVIMKNGEDVYEKTIIVNDPIRYEGISIYQSSYGTVPPEVVTVSMESRSTGMVYEESVKIGDAFFFPEDGTEVVLSQYIPSFRLRGHNLGETFVCRVTEEGKQPADIILPVRFAMFDKMRKGSFVLSISDYELRHYTGLQITKDPGVSMVYAGFIILIIGCYITFFISHRSLCMEVTDNENRSSVMIAGNANKNFLGIDRKVDQVAGCVAKLENRNL